MDDLPEATKESIRNSLRRYTALREASQRVVFAKNKLPPLTTVGSGVMIGKRRRRVMPMPEVLSNSGSKPWRVEEIPPNRSIAGMVDARHNIMAIPTDPEVVAQNVRAHEMAHVQWTPKLKKPPRGLDHIIWNVAEDIRINTKLVQEAGVNIYDGFLDDETMAQNIAAINSLQSHPENAKAIVLAMVNNTPTKNAIIMRNQVEMCRQQAEAQVTGSGVAWRRVLRIYDDVVEYMRDAPRPLSFDTALAIARYLQTILADPEEVTADSLAKASKPIQGEPLTEEELAQARGKAQGKPQKDGGEDEGEAEGTEEGEGDGTEEPGQGENSDEDFAQGDSPEMAPGYAYPWGPMTIEPLRLRVPIPGTFYGRKWRPTDAGTLPKYMNRWSVDKQIWGLKKRQRGGTVLIDGSGSMRLNKEDVYSVMKAAPGATVAIYAGNGRTGALRILVQKNRRVEDALIAQPSDGDNTVDGPALRWLLKQKGPRIWVSDGKVVGVGGQGPGNLIEAELLCRRGKVMRIDTCQEAVRIFEHLNSR